MGTKIRWPESAIKAMLVRIERGDSIESIAQSYGVSHRSIRNALGIKPGDGRVDRAASKREFKKKVVHVDVHLDSFIDRMATQLNTTHGMIVEMALFAMYEHEVNHNKPVRGHSAFMGPLERFMINHHLIAIREEFYNESH